MRHFHGVVEASTQHATRLQVVEHSDERVPEAADVVENDALVVVADGGSCEHGEYLVECAHATRQRDYYVAALNHKVFAVGEVVAENLHVDIVGHLSAFLHYRRHHAHGHSLCVVHSLRYALHQSEVASAEHQRMPVGTHPGAQFARALEVFGGDI